MGSLSDFSLKIFLGAAVTIAMVATLPQDALGAGDGSLTAGDLSVTATSGMSIVIPDKGDTDVRLGAGAEYFFKDAISAGGLFDLESTAGTNALSLGPTGSYYFFRKDRLVAAARGAFLLGNLAPRSGPSTTFFNLRIGASAEYFVARNVAFGPELQLRFLFGSDRLTRNYETALLGRFSLYF